jgi:hypothetical protein
MTSKPCSGLNQSKQGGGESIKSYFDNIKTIQEITEETDKKMRIKKRRGWLIRGLF